MKNTIDVKLSKSEIGMIVYSLETQREIEEKKGSIHEDKLVNIIDKLMDFYNEVQ